MYSISTNHFKVEGITLPVCGSGAQRGGAGGAGGEEGGGVLGSRSTGDPYANIASRPHLYAPPPVSPNKRSPQDWSKVNDVHYLRLEGKPMHFC